MDYRWYTWIPNFVLGLKQEGKLAGFSVVQRSGMYLSHPAFGILFLWWENSHSEWVLLVVGHRESRRERNQRHDTHTNFSSTSKKAACYPNITGRKAKSKPTKPPSPTFLCVLQTKFTNTPSGWPNVSTLLATLLPSPHNTWVCNATHSLYPV